MSLELPTRLSRSFEPLIDYAERINRLNGGTATAIVVIRGDTIVAERYSGSYATESGPRPVGEQSRFYAASVRKSYIGLCAAWAVHEGLIRGLDDPIADYLTDEGLAPFSGATLRHLLTHTHGLSRDEEGRLFAEFPAGSGWAYNNTGVELLERIIGKACGRSVPEIFRKRIADPLGLKRTGWERLAAEEMVRFIAGPGEADMLESGGLYVSARELAYWGLSPSARGTRRGAPGIVPEEAVRMATTVQSPMLRDADLPSNGFLWQVKTGSARYGELGGKVPIGSYQIVGITGPLLLVVPDRELVVVRMYNKLYNYGGPENDYLRYLREFGDRAMECL